MSSKTSLLSARLFIPAGLFLPIAASLAADVTWNNPATGAFTTGTNWTPTGVPGSGDNAIIANGGTAELTTGESASVRQLRINNGAFTQDNATLNTGITSSSWQTTGDLQVGSPGLPGSMTVSGASTINTGRVRIGGYNNGSDSSAVHGSLTMTGGTLTTASGYDFWLGSGPGGTANLTMSGDSQIDVRNSGTAGRNGASATATQSGTSKFKIQTGFAFSEGGSATWTVEDNASLEIGGQANIAQGGTGSITVKDNAKFSAGGNLSVGQGGTATLTVTGGEVSSGGEFWVGNGGSSDGTVNLSGGTITSGSWVAVGRDGAKGTLNVSGGSLTRNGTASNHFVTNGTADKVATINHTGGTITNTISETQLAENAGNVTAWSASGGTGNFADLQVGRSGMATLTISGTANYTATTVRLGVNASGTGVLNLNGGTLTANSVSKVDGGGTINFNGGTLRAGAASGDFLAGFEDADLHIQDGGLVFDTNGHSVSILQGLSGTGGVTKLGAGTLTFASINVSYLGDTTIAGGTLSISTAFLSDASSVWISGSGVFDLNFVGTDTIDRLFINGVAQSAGTWGAIGSGAQFESALFTGDGLLLVAVPEPAHYAIGVLVMLGLAITTRRKRAA